MSGDLERLLGSTPCACGHCRPVKTERVAVTEDLAAVVVAELDGREAALLGDERTLGACGNSLGREMSRLGVRVTVTGVMPDGGEPHADRATVDRVRARLSSLPATAVPIAVGAGTVNDLVKAAAHGLGRRYVSVPTAPSMNGYTSSIAAITEDGLKRTLASDPPIAVLAHPDVLAKAPSRLALSGLADLLSKPVSSADWLLSHILWDEPFCPFPAEVASRAVERAARNSGDLRQGSRNARLALFDALIVSGLSMTIAGSSSPASGGEHLISHTLDMIAAHEPGGPRQPALHGEQVGVATRATTRLWSNLLSRPEDQIDWNRAERCAPDEADMHERLDGLEWLPSALLDRFARESASKLRRIGPAPERIKRVRERWSVLRANLRANAEEASRYIDVLPAVGASSTAGDLGIAAESFRLAYRVARWVRDRYTILDLVDDLGLREELEDIALDDIV